MKNKKIDVQKAIKMTYKENKRSSLVIYLILRFLVIICMILQILRGDLNNALLCLLSLILLFAPLFIQNKFEITLPNDLEIAIYLFIFSAEILGEIDNFFGIIPYWDIILHTINGFLATAVGFSLVDLLNKNSKNINLSPFYLCLVALNPDGENKAVVVDDIGKTIIYDTNGDVLQVIDNGYLDIGLNDTIEDLFVNFIGAIVFSCFAFFDLKHNRSNSFINRFVPTKGNNKLIKSI